MSTEPMDWIEFHLARQLLGEEKVGTRLRGAGQAEDDEFAEAIKHASRG